MKKLKNFLRRLILGPDISGDISRFTNETISWANEIEDGNLKLEFIGEILFKNIKSHSEISEFRKELIKKWHKHIPSMNAEVREIKLKKILK